MSKLRERFDKEVENRKFNFFEITGFKSQPKLALIAGMAIGYGMAISDIASKQECEKET